MSDSPGNPPAARSEASEATRGSAIKLGTELASRLLGFLTTPILTRGLGVAAFGLFARHSVIAVIAAEAAELGLQATASRALVASDLPLGAMLRAKAILTVIVVAACLIGIAWGPVFVPLVLFFVLAGWGEFLGVALRARGHRLRESALILCLRVLGVILVWIALGLGLGLVGVSWAFVASAVPSIALGAFLLRGTGGSRPVPSDPGIGAVLRSSAPLAVNGGLALLSLRVEMLAVWHFHGDRETGLFVTALRVVEFLNLVPSAVGAGAMPALTREALSGAGDAVRRRTVATVVFLGAPAAAGAALVAPGLLSVIFGAEYAEAATSLRVLALAVVPLFLNGILVSALIATGRGEWLPRLTAVRVGLAAALAFLLVPRFGGLGAAWGFMASETALLALTSHACAAAGFRVNLAGPTARALLASLPMVLVLLGFARAAPLPLAVGIGVLAYAVTLGLAWKMAPGLLRDLGSVVRYAEGRDGHP
ncbi:MAG: polysaccharide biosynthesis C-terminal domain-containing protein [Solirubrobacterales bacterium]